MRPRRRLLLFPLYHTAAGPQNHFSGSPGLPARRTALWADTQQTPREISAAFKANRAALKISPRKTAETHEATASPVRKPPGGDAGAARPSPTPRAFPIAPKKQHAPGPGARCFAGGYERSAWRRDKRIAGGRRRHRPQPNGLHFRPAPVGKRLHPAAGWGEVPMPSHRAGGARQRREAPCSSEKDRGQSAPAARTARVCVPFVAPGAAPRPLRGCGHHQEAALVGVVAAGGEGEQLVSIGRSNAGIIERS